VLFRLDERWSQLACQTRQGLDLWAKSPERVELTLVVTTSWQMRRDPFRTLNLGTRHVSELFLRLLYGDTSAHTSDLHVSGEQEAYFVRVGHSAGSVKQHFVRSDGRATLHRRQQCRSLPFSFPFLLGL
jgi:hypothetical protein